MKRLRSASNRGSPSANPARWRLDALQRAGAWPDQTIAASTVKVIQVFSLAAGLERGHSVVKKERAVGVRDSECSETGLMED